MTQDDIISGAIARADAMRPYVKDAADRAAEAGRAAAEVDKLPGLKEDELARCGPCPLCGEPLLSTKHGFTFYRITMSRAGLNQGALERRVGLQMVLGGSAPLAQAMGPNEDLARVFDGPHEIVVHEDCAARVGHLLQLVAEKA